MKAKVAVYNSHEEAINALKNIAKNNFPMKQVSLVGKAEIIQDHLHIKSLENVKNTPLLVGAGAGTILGLLTGMGTLAIPGFGVFYGAGAVVGAFAGFDIGVITGGLGSLLATIGIKKDQMVKIDEHINEGKFFIVVNGTLDEITWAEKILHTEGTHLEIL